MSGDWLQVVLLLAALPFTPERRHPLTPWQRLHADAYAYVVNHTQDSLPVGVIAPRVDRVIRFLGFAKAQDSTYFKLPYADTVVLLLVGNGWMPLTVDHPGIYRVVVRPLPREPWSQGDP